MFSDECKSQKAKHPLSISKTANRQPGNMHEGVQFIKKKNQLIEKDLPLK